MRHLQAAGKGTRLKRCNEEPERGKSLPEHPRCRGSSAWDSPCTGSLLVLSEAARGSKPRPGTCPNMQGLLGAGRKFQPFPAPAPQLRISGGSSGEPLGSGCKSVKEFFLGGVSPAPSLELGFDLRAGKTRGGERPRQMDAAQKSHLVYRGFEGKERRE